MHFIHSSKIVLLPVESIVPKVKQPRKSFDIQELENLSQSILENGLLQPITVRPLKNNDFEIVAGERRYRACIMAGITRIPAIVSDSSDERSAVLSLTENIQRQDLHFFEQAKAIDLLIKTYSYSVDHIATLLGKTPDEITDLLGLLDLPQDVQRTIVENGLSQDFASALLKLSDENDASDVLNTIISEKLSILQTDELINKLIEDRGDGKNKKPRMFFKDIKLFVNTLDHAVEIMNKSGIDAQKEQFETDSYVRYSVTIPKSTPVIRSRK